MKKILFMDNLFLLTILCMPLYLVRVSIFGLPTNIFELLAIATITLWVLKNKNSKATIRRDIPKLLFASTLFVLLGTILSILFNDSYAAGFGILKSWFFIPIIFSYALYTRLKSKLDFEKIFLSVYFSISLIAIIGIVYKLAGKVTYDNRLEIFYGSPNYLAMYLSSGFFFGVYFLLKSWFQKKYSKKIFFHLFLLIIVSISLFFTYSYGALSASLAALFLSAAVIFPNKKYFLLGIFVSVAFLAFIFQINSPKFSGLFSERSSLASRMIICDASLLMIKENPILGIGPGNFQTNYLALQKHFPPYLEWAVPEPHNLFLAFWIQSGLLGIIGFLSLLYFIFNTLWISLKHKKDALTCASLLGFFLYTILHGLTDTTYWKNDLSFIFWINTFLLVYLSKKLSSKTEESFLN